MWPATRAAFRTITEPLEGNIPWMYRDSLGYVTVGIGNKIDPLTAAALVIPFRDRKSGAWALEADIRTEWEIIKAGKLGAAEAKKMAALEVSEDDRIKLFDDTTDKFETTLKKQFSGWEPWPADAQLAVLSMAWNFGPNLTAGWPDLSKHLVAGDWAWAAQHCEPAVGPSARSRQNKVLFYQAARADLVNAEPAVLFGPSPVPSAAQLAAAAKAPDRMSSHAWWVQAMLQDAGLYTLGLDGQFGPRSVAAWEAFLKAHKSQSGGGFGYSEKNLRVLSNATLRLEVTA